MRKKIFCLLVTALAAFIQLLPLLAAEANSLKCGWMVFIELQEPYKIYINGNYKGITPQLITGLPAGEFKLRLEGADKYHEVTGISDASVSELKVYKPVPERYKGELQLTSTPPGAEIRIDDVFRGKTPLLLKDLEEGNHKVSVSRSGYREEKHTVKVTRTGKAKLESNLARLYNISFEPPLAGEISVSCKNETENPVFIPGENCILPAGVWQLTLKGAGILPETREITVNTDLTVSFIPVPFDSKLVLPNLQPGCMVFVDYKDVTNQLTNNTLLIPAGRYNLTISRPQYMNFSSTVNVLDDRNTIVEIQYIKDPQIIKQNKQTAGWITAGAGAALSIVSLVVNLDEISIGMSGGNYGGYELIKYSSLGTLSAGAAGVIVGLLLQL